MEEIAAIRAELEPLAMRLAVEHATDAELDEAQGLIERMRDADLATWVELNAAFHSVVHDASASPTTGMITTVTCVPMFHGSHFSLMKISQTKNA
jgi:DNA-binding GntR family transcriptional regulator